VCRTTTIFLPAYTASLNTHYHMLFHCHLTNRKFFRATWKKSFDQKLGHFCTRDENNFNILFGNICWL